MRVRWFGEPWPSEELRAPICEEDEWKVETPIGEACLYCELSIVDGDQGVIMAAVPEIVESFTLELPDGARCVAAEHLNCFLLSILGPEITGMTR